ncbi:MAG: sensor histidine kinase [Bacteroidota bacterium]
MNDAQQSDFILTLFIGTAGMLLLAGGIVFFVLFYQKRMLKSKIEKQEMEANYQKKLLKATIDSQEKERERIASELHDGVGAMLSTVKLYLNLLSPEASANQEDAESLTDTKGLLDDTIETVRGISKELLPKALEMSGLTKAVEELCDKIDNPKGLRVRFAEEGAEKRLEKEKELLVYRIIQELINNAIKHSQAQKIEVKIGWQNGTLNLAVMDDGVGFDMDEVNQRSGKDRGIGLYTIENRASLLNADVDFSNNQEGGARIELSMQVG